MMAASCCEEGRLDEYKSMWAIGQCCWADSWCSEDQLVFFQSCPLHLPSCCSPSSASPFPVPPRQYYSLLGRGGEEAAEGREQEFPEQSQEERARKWTRTPETGCPCRVPGNPPGCRQLGAPQLRCTPPTTKWIIEEPSFIVLWPSPGHSTLTSTCVPLVLLLTH